MPNIRGKRVNILFSDVLVFLGSRNSADAVAMLLRVFVAQSDRSSNDSEQIIAVLARTPRKTKMCRPLESWQGWATPLDLRMRLAAARVTCREAPFKATPMGGIEVL